jgi:hypothetical protein
MGKILLRIVPRRLLELALNIPDPDGRQLALKLLRHPTFVRNFLELGAEEIRNLPQVPDVSHFLLAGVATSSLKKT